MLHYFNIVNKHTKNYISNCFIIWKLVHQPVIKDPVKISSREREKIREESWVWKGEFLPAEREYSGKSQI